MEEFEQKLGLKSNEESNKLIRYCYDCEPRIIKAFKKKRMAGYGLWGLVLFLVIILLVLTVTGLSKETMGGQVV